MRTGRLVIRKFYIRNPPGITFGFAYMGRFIRASIKDVLKDDVFHSRWLKLKYEN